MILEAHNSIVIQPVNNGWIVLLPFQHPIGMTMDYESQIRHQTRIMKEGMNNDNILPKAKAQEPQELNIEAIKDKSVHIFQKWEDVLSFLKFKIVETNQK